MTTSYFASINTNKAITKDIFVASATANDDTAGLIEIFNELSLDDITKIDSIEIAKYVTKENDKRSHAERFKGMSMFILVDGVFVETKDRTHRPLKRHIKVIEEINRIIASKKNDAKGA